MTKDDKIIKEIYNKIYENIEKTNILSETLDGITSVEDISIDKNVYNKKEDVTKNIWYSSVDPSDYFKFIEALKIDAKNGNLKYTINDVDFSEDNSYYIISIWYGKTNQKYIDLHIDENCPNTYNMIQEYEQNNSGETIEYYE